MLKKIEILIDDTPRHGKDQANDALNKGKGFQYGSYAKVQCITGVDSPIFREAIDKAKGV